MPLNTSTETGLESCEHKKQKRLDEFKRWFDNFTTTFRRLQATGKYPVSHTDTGNFRFADGAAEKVNRLYWSLMDEFIRPMVKAKNGDPDTNIDRHKIWSLIELTILMIQPIDSAGNARILNARLAYYCAVACMAEWLGIDVKYVFNACISKEASENHRAWLLSYNIDEPVPPFFLNALNWQLIEESYKLRMSIAKKRLYVVCSG